MKSSKGGSGIHMNIQKGGNGDNMQALLTSNYFIVRQVVLLGVSDHCVKKTKCTPCPVHMNIYFKISMDRIIKSYEIQIPPIGCS